MHTLEHLADVALKKEHARLEARLAQLRSVPDWTHALEVVPLAFDKTDEGASPSRDFEVAVELAKRVTRWHGGMPLTRITISRAATGKLHVQARSDIWSGFALLTPMVLVEEWDAASRTVAARYARDEELSGRQSVRLEIDPKKVAQAIADADEVGALLGSAGR